MKLRKSINWKIGIASLILLFAAVGSGLLFSQKAAALPVPAAVATDVKQCNTGFFGLKPWYQYMSKELGPPPGDPNADDCSVRCFNFLAQSKPNLCGQTSSDIPGVLLALIDDLLRIAGLVAVAFILIGSFEFVASRGNAEKTASAQSTIIAALTGLAVAIVAVAFVAFLGRTLKG